MILQTKRCVLRPWRESDAPALYEYARDPHIGPAAGWPVHTDVQNSRRIIQEVLSEEETYAVVLRGDSADRPVGSIGLMFGTASNLPLGEGEAELGYWVGVPFWGQGLIPEAAHELMRHGFETLGLHTIWCGYFAGNEKSRRVQEKCGFRPHHVNKDQPWPLMGDIRTEYITCITRAQWEELCEAKNSD